MRSPSPAFTPDTPRTTYRVEKRLTWIEGGRPDGLRWEGGTPKTYHPGETIRLADAEVESIAHGLSALDPHGRAVLADATRKLEAPAAVSMGNKKSRRFLSRAASERLRRTGDFPALVNQMLDRGDQPAVADVVRALKGGEPPSPALIAHVVTILTRRRRPGRKKKTSDHSTDVAVYAYYRQRLRRAAKLRDRTDGPRAVKAIAKRQTAARFGISVRSVERIIADLGGRTLTS